MSDQIIEARFRAAVFSLMLIGSFFFLREALTFHPSARHAPVAAGVAACAVCTIAVAREATRIWRARQGTTQTYSRSDESSDEVINASTLKASAKYLIVLVVFIALIATVGLIAAATVMLGYLLRFDAQQSWRFTIISIGCAWFAFWIIQVAFGLIWPLGLFG